MVRAGKQPHDMRRDQTDEADRPADGHAHADQRRHAHQQPQLHASDVHADEAGVVLAHGEGVQLSGVQQNRAAENDERDQQHQRVHVGASGQTAHRPEGDLPQTVGREGDDQAHGAGNEHRIDYADQDDRVGGQGAVEMEGERQNK